jgi:multiple sugar transport system permease protein
VNPRRRDFRRWGTGMAFLLPNIVGFCAFTLVPLILSFAMAFTNWDILRHNRFRHEPLHFVGLQNFTRLFADPQFWRDLANTLWFLLGLPFAIAGSLGLALLLTRVSRRRPATGPALLGATLVFVASGAVLLAGGVAAPGVLGLFGLMAAGVLVAGVLTGGTVYRTLFYLPHFTAGVATFVLWKKLYNPHTGPFNTALAPALDGFAAVVRAAPGCFSYGLPLLAGVGGAGLAVWQVRRLRRRWVEGDAGAVTIVAGALTLGVPLAFFLAGFGLGAASAAVVAGGGVAVLLRVVLRQPRRWGATRPAETGLGAELSLALVGVPLLLLLAGAIRLGPMLPALAAAGLDPPNWLGDYAWAKPALMIMALWAAIGSNSMILYLAGLSNIPPELYEAADMDGASALQRFWHITWPQLAPITFFIAIMGVINGLQGGFEMARTMTLGGPAGSTTTLSYFIFTEGFETGRLGYASAIAWVLFGLVLVFALLNFRFGNRGSND